MGKVVMSKVMGKQDKKVKAGRAVKAPAKPSKTIRAAASPAKKAPSAAARPGKPAAKATATRSGTQKAKAAAKTTARKSAATKATVTASLPPKSRATTTARPVVRAVQKPSDKKLVQRAKASAIVLPPDYRPSEDEPFMNEHQRLYFRQKLLNWREEIIRQTKETLEGLHEDSVQHADLADRATSETDRALELRARDRQRKLISKIDAALARIEDGTYGYCEETGEPIGLKRLDARPIATLSLEAQERHERRERVYRED